MDLERFFTMNNVNNETSNRISSVIENLFRSRTVDLLQTLTFNQIDGQIKYALSSSDWDTFQKFQVLAENTMRS